MNERGGRDARRDGNKFFALVMYNDCNCGKFAFLSVWKVNLGCIVAKVQRRNIFRR